MNESLIVKVPVLHHGPWYLKAGDTVPAEVPETLRAAWLAAKYIAPAAAVPPASKE